MTVDVFDRVLNRDDVAAGVLIAITDHRGQRRRLTGTGAAYDDHQTTLGHYNLFENWWKLQLLKLRNLGIDGPQHRADAALLDKRADPEPPDMLRCNREMALFGCIELFALIVVHDRADDQRALFLAQRPVGRRANTAVDFYRRGKSRGNKQIRSVHLDHAFQQVLHETYCLIAFHTQSPLATRPLRMIPCSPRGSVLPPDSQRSLQPAPASTGPVFACLRTARSESPNTSARPFLRGSGF